MHNCCTESFVVPLILDRQNFFFAKVFFLLPMASEDTNKAKEYTYQSLCFYFLLLYSYLFLKPSPMSVHIKG